MWGIIIRGKRLNYFFVDYFILFGIIFMNCNRILGMDYEVFCYLFFDYYASIDINVYNLIIISICI